MRVLTWLSARTDTPKLTRPWAVFLLLLTGLYLALELPFAAHLLDIVGTTSDPDLIHSTEVVGRLISGFAAALAIWGLWTIPRGIARARRRGRRTSVLGVLLMSVLLGAPAAVGVYKGEAHLIDRLVDRSTAEQRQTALAVLLFTGQYQKGRATIEGFPLSDEDMREPTGKTFVALLPLMAASMKDIRNTLEPTARAFARQQIVEKLGSPSQFYNRAYVQALREIDQRFDQYYDGLRKLYAADDKAERRADEAWRDYQQQLQKRRIRMPVNARQCTGIKREMKKRGNAYPDDWNCNDGNAYRQHVAAQVRRAAEREFDQQLIRQLGEKLPRDITSATVFLRQPAVQARWRRDTGLDRSATLQYGMSLETFTRQVYEPLLDRLVDAQMQRIKADVRHYERGGAYHQDGVRAYRAMIVPPIALGFSLLGAVFHVIKSVVLLLHVLRPGLAWPLRYASGGVCMLLTFTTLLIPNTLTRTSLFARLIDESRASGGALLAMPMAWIAHTQPLLYPINDGVRRQIERLGTASGLPWISFWAQYTQQADRRAADAPAQTAQAAAAAQERSAARRRGLMTATDALDAPATPIASAVAKDQPAAAAPAPLAAAAAAPVSTPSGAIASANCSGLRIDAHRGDAAAPENSVQAALLAYENGADAVEIDIQRLRDGTWVVHHDPLLGRTVNGQGEAAALTSAQWQALRLYDRQRRLTDTPPPSLREMVEAVQPWLDRGRSLNIEFKQVLNCAAIQDGLAQLHGWGVSDRQLTLTSIDRNAVRCLNGIYSGYRAQIMLSSGDRVQGKLGAALKRYVADSFSPARLRTWNQQISGLKGLHLAADTLRADPGIVARTRKLGIRSFVYADSGRDADILAAIRAARDDSGELPDGAIIDGRRDGFCAQLAAP